MCLMCVCDSVRGRGWEVKLEAGELGAEVWNVDVRLDELGIVANDDQGL